MTVDLGALLGGPQQEGPQPGGTSDSITSRDSGEDLDHIRTAIQALQLYAQNNHDDVELAKVHKCIVALQSILADHAKNKDAALGTTPAFEACAQGERRRGLLVDDRQFELLGVVPGDVEGAVKEVTLRMTRAAEEGVSFREILADLAAERGGVYARALKELEPKETRKQVEAVSS